MKCKLCENIKLLARDENDKEHKLGSYEYREFMKKNNQITLYKKYHIDKDDERLGLFLILSEKFQIKSELYAGSFVHITKSFVFKDCLCWRQ